MEWVKLTYTPLPVEEVLRQSGRPDCGALVTFLGVSRNHHKGREVRTLFYEAHESMAQKKLEQVRQEAMEKYSVRQVFLWHRLGEVPVGEASLLVVVAAPHRREALEAVAYMIDRIKEDVPIWKKEFFCDGQAEWVEGEHH